MPLASNDIDITGALDELSQLAGALQGEIMQDEVEQTSDNRAEYRVVQQLIAELMPRLEDLRLYRRGRNSKEINYKMRHELAPIFINGRIG